jgi:hypothetical protein
MLTPACCHHPRRFPDISFRCAYRTTQTPAKIARTPTIHLRKKPPARGLPRGGGGRETPSTPVTVMRQLLMAQLFAQFKPCAQIPRC